MKRIRPKNWNEFQHYKDRSPIWIKLHKRLLDDFTFQRLPVASRALAPMLWLLASEYTDGEIPFEQDAIAFRLRMSETELDESLQPLLSAGFFEVMLDAIEPLADCKRAAIPEKRTSNKKETETDDDKARELLSRICEILRIELQADPERLTWKRQVFEMLRDGLTEAEIIAATETARTRGKINLAYIRTIALNPKPKDADNAPGKRSTQQQGRGIREAVEHALAATQRDAEGDTAERAGQSPGASGGVVNARATRATGNGGGDHPPSGDARSDLSKSQHDDRGTELEIPTFLLRPRPSAGVENRPSVQALPARSGEPLVSNPRPITGAGEVERT